MLGFFTGMNRENVPQMIKRPSKYPLTLTVVSSVQVFFASVRPGGASQVYFMTLGRTSLMSW